MSKTNVKCQENMLMLIVSWQKLYELGRKLDNVVSLFAWPYANVARIISLTPDSFMTTAIWKYKLRSHPPSLILIQCVIHLKNHIENSLFRSLA